MRSSLLKSFDEIYVLNLHGSVRRDAKQAQEQGDAPVFQIQQGTAIILAVKGTGTKIMRYCDCFGSLKSKFAYLNSNDLTTTSWIDVKPVAPNFFFVPSAEASVDIALEYDAYPSLTDIFGTGNRSQDKEKRWATGMATQQDEFAVSFDDGEVKRKISELLASNSEDELRSKYALCTTDQWSYQRAKKELAAGAWKPNLFDYAYRPFSTMRSVFDRNVISILRAAVMKQLVSHNNIALVASRVVNDADFAHIFVTDKPVDKIFLSSKTSTNAYVFPLYLYDSAEEQNLRRGGGTMQKALFEPSAGYATHRANLNPQFIEDVTQRLGLKWLPVDRGDLKKTIGPEDAFNYAYAVFHSPTYRERYAEFLRIDVARLPLTSDLKLFRALVAKGAELVSLHLMKSATLEEFVTEFPVRGDNEIENVQYTVSDQRVWINAKQYFGGVPKWIWDFQVGGYQVCEKWLKIRKGRKLTYGDMQHYQKVIVALRETSRLMREIDESIPNWPMQ